MNQYQPHSSVEPDEQNSVQIFAVHEVAQMTHDLLSECFSTIWITGEVSNLAKPASGHMYFTIKDAKAQLRAVMFRGTSANASAIQNGMQITVAGTLSLYAPRGDLQIIVRQLFTEGAGSLAIQFEQLRQYCKDKGWFSTDHKKPLPKRIKRIGVITSDQAAACYDVLKVLKRRDPQIEVVLYPSQVQGELAPSQLIRALECAQRHQYVDVILMTRGGGSQEDLFCFNDVKLVEAVFNATIPIVTAVGHEIDTTLVDWAADVRAATPSAGAELLSQDSKQQQAQMLDSYAQLVYQSIMRTIKEHRLILEGLERACTSPLSALAQQKQQLSNYLLRLQQAMHYQLRLSDQQISSMEQKLEALNPLAILQRGYAMVTDATTNQILTQAAAFKPQQSIHLQLADGSVSAIVKDKLK